MSAIIVEPVLRYFVEISAIVDLAQFYVLVYIEYADDCKFLVCLDCNAIERFFFIILLYFIDNQERALIL